MWLFTKHGFYSVVRARTLGGEGKTLSPNMVMIRARSKAHLEALREKFEEVLWLRFIVENSGTDYPYRMIVTDEELQRIMVGLASEIDYGNFKDEAKKLRDPEYNWSLTQVWGEMFEYQKSQRMRGRNVFAENDA